MTNFIFKSANRLIKNESINLGLSIDKITVQLRCLLTEQRQQRQDLQDIKRMINKVLIDKHLQMQVDEYFNDNENNIPDSGDLD